MDDASLIHNEMENSEDIVNSEIIKKIEAAYRVYQLNKLYLADVCDDYGKQKIAKLRMEFSRHELSMLLKEAAQKGIPLGKTGILKEITRDP